MSGSITHDTTSVTWDPVSAPGFEDPLVWTGPFVECKLEHRGLEPTCVGEQFFPDSIPYRTDSEQRIFYWRSRLPDVTTVAETWTALCATTHELVPLTHDETHRPSLFQACASGSELVIDGAIVGDAKTAFVSEYSAPEIDLRYVTGDCAEFVVSGETKLVPVGESDRFELPKQTVETEFGTPVTTVPHLVVRFPGERTLYHPGSGSDYHLFPSFGLDLDDVPTPLDVPMNHGQLDQEALAEELGVDITSRPYPARILWQAFVFTAFDPTASSPVELTQFPSGKIAVRID